MKKRGVSKSAPKPNSWAAKRKTLEAVPLACRAASWIAAKASPADTWMIRAVTADQRLAFAPDPSAASARNPTSTVPTVPDTQRHEAVHR